MTWLVTGGAGYVGAHVVREFLAADIPVTVLDDLSTGQLAFIPAKVSFTRGTVLDGSVLERVFTEHSVTGVVHLAGSTDDAGSVLRPLHSYEQNVDGTSVLLAAMQDKGVGKIAFASSTAVYGMPTAEVLTEDLPPAPRTPFGESKLICEWLLRDQTVAAALAHTTLRLPDVVGTAEPTIFDPRSHAPLAAVFEALGQGRAPVITGDEHATPDGTLVREFVHAGDVALAIVAAVRRMDAGEPLETVYNLGTGEGISQRQLLEAVASGTGLAFEPEIGPGAAGTPARIVASSALAARDLGWAQRHPLDRMIATAWAARAAATEPDRALGAS
jgi:UDP-glucose 4-epimerase